MSNFALNFNMFCDMIDQIIDYNKDFVARKGYEKYLTDKYPDKKLAERPHDLHTSYLWHIPQTDDP